jgi:large subunit ribosomal protein L9
MKNEKYKPLTIISNMTKVILAVDIPGQGKKNDIVEVSDGFARNFLIPKNKAYPATPRAIERIQLEKAKSDQIEKKRKENVEQEKEKVEKTEIMVTKKAKDGKLFGSVTAKDISLALREKGLSITPKQVIIKTPIKTRGKHNIGISLDNNTHAELKLKVEEEKSI